MFDRMKRQSHENLSAFTASTSSATSTPWLSICPMIGIFGLVIAVIFAKYPISVFPVWAEIPLALVVGLWVYKRKGQLLIPSLVALCSGFVYVLARVGITGEREGAPEIADRITLVRRHTDLPVAVGFGISTAEHVAAVTEHADAVIVGSALVRRMGDAADAVETATTFVSSLADGLREPSVS